MEMATLKDLAVHSLQDIYSAENQLMEALPQMAQAASHPELRNAFNTHLEQTRGQVQRLEQIFQKLGQQPGGVHCKGMQGLVAEAQEMLKEDAAPDVRDAALIESAQKAEHYEIASYGTAMAYAKLLGQQDALQLLEQNLEEEKQTDQKLSGIAERVVNPDAVNG